MVSSVSGLLTTARKYGGYGANFILGTGSTVIGNEVQAAAKARKATGTGFGKSVFDGFKKGVQASNQQVAQTGFIGSIRNAFKSLPEDMGSGWKNANTAGKSGIGKFFSKLGGFFKPLGRTMPFVFNALVLLSSVPAIMERSQDEGIWGGIKETGKAIGKMGLYALGSALGAAFGGIGSFAGAITAGLVTDTIFGKDYLTEKSEKEEKLAQFQEAANGVDNSYPFDNQLDYIV